MRSFRRVSAAAPSLCCLTHNKGSCVCIFRHKAKPALCERLLDDHQLLAQWLHPRRKLLLHAQPHRNNWQVRILVNYAYQWKTIQSFGTEHQLLLFFFYLCRTKYGCELKETDGRYFCSIRIHKLQPGVGDTFDDADSYDIALCHRASQHCEELMKEYEVYQNSEEPNYLKIIILQI